jgi:outer membrane protein OmpA-like peptidoglycan-associated protein
MQPRYLVLALFAVWSLLCWYWYVCIIKESCRSEAAATEAPIPTRTPAQNTPQPVEALPKSSVQPAGQAPTAAAFPAPSGILATAPNRLLDRPCIEQSDARVRIYLPYNYNLNKKSPELNAYLKKLAQYLIESGRSVTITGHTDMVGDAEKNRERGLEQARKLKELLVAKKVPDKQISCRSMGESNPIESNDTPGGRYLNRRLEIE